jgi:hypothetical protein
MSCLDRFDSVCAAKSELTPPVLPIYGDETSHSYGRAFHELFDWQTATVVPMKGTHGIAKQTFQ